MGGARRRKGRGHEVAAIVSFNKMDATAWILYSHGDQLRLHLTIDIGRKHGNTTASQRYAFHERVVNVLRPLVRRGLRTVVLLSPPKSERADKFLAHVKAHHQWLVKEGRTDSASFALVEGHGDDQERLSYVVTTPEFKKALGGAAAREGEEILAVLEKRLNDDERGLFLHGLAEIENFLYSGGTKKKKFAELPVEPEYILVAASLMRKGHQKHRIERLLQVGKNRGVKARILDDDLPAGQRLVQLGGIACFMRADDPRDKEKVEKLASNARR